MPLRGKSISQDQEDRGQPGTLAHRKEVPDGWGAESQMGMWSGKGGWISQVQIVKFPG